VGRRVNRKGEGGRWLGRRARGMEGKWGRGKEGERVEEEGDRRIKRPNEGGKQED